MFALINVGERSGTGLCDVYSIWEENRFKKPSLIETVAPDRVTLTLQIELDGRNDGVNDGVNDGDSRDLNKTQIRIYTEIKKNPSSTAASIATNIGLSKPTVERAITVLKKKGYIVREGSTKAGKWIPRNN